MHASNVYFDISMKTFWRALQRENALRFCVYSL